MCTQFTLHYTCGHKQTSLRCPRSTFTYKSANGGTATYTTECGNKTFVDGRLDDNCIDCKVANGLVPGLQTGLDVWADEGKGLTADADEGVEGSGNGSMYGTLNGHETLETPAVSSGRTSVDLGGSEENGDNVESRLRTALGRAGDHMGSGGNLIRDNVNGVNGKQEQRQRLERVKTEEDEDSWMWGGMEAFGGEVER